MSENGKTPKEPPDKPPHYHGHRQRMRQRFLDGGSNAVSDYELLELILFRAIPIRDVKPLAKELLEKFGSFAEVRSNILALFVPRSSRAFVNQGDR